MPVGFHGVSDHTRPEDGPRPPVYPCAVVLEKLHEAWDTGGMAWGPQSPTWLGRPMFDGFPTVAELTSRCRIVHGAGGDIQLGNEWNNAVEKWPGTATQSGLDVLVQTWQFVRIKLPADARIGWGAASPDCAMYRDTYDLDRNQPGVAEVIERANFIILHAYGSHARIKSLVQEVHERWPDKQIWLAEYNWGAGNPKPQGWEDGLLDTLSFLEHLRLRSQPGVRALRGSAFFAWYWKDGPHDVDGRGSSVQTVIDRFTAGQRVLYEPESHPAPEPAPVPAPAPEPEVAPVPVVTGNPYAQKMLTVWNLPKKPGDLIAWCQRLGITAVEIKVCDGDSSWVGRRNVTPVYVQALRDGGIHTVCGWGYHYCDYRVDAGDRGNGVPQDEGETAAACVRALGLDGYTWDLEIETEKSTVARADEAVGLMFESYDNSMQEAGYTKPPEGAHVWAYKTGHENYAWLTVRKRGVVVRPMIYQDDWDATKSFSDTEIGPYLRQVGDRVAPVMGITDSAVTPEVLQKDWTIFKAFGVIGVSFWEYSALPAGPGVVEWINALRMPKEASVPVVDPQNLILDRLGALWDKKQDFRAAIENFQAGGDPALEQFKIGLREQLAEPVNAMFGLAKKAKGLEA